MDTIEVRWPTTGKTESFAGVKANQILTIREGSGIVDRKGPAGAGDRDPSLKSDQKTGRAAAPGPPYR